MDNTSSSALPAHPGEYDQYVLRLCRINVLSPDPDSPESKKPMTDFTLINAKGFYPFVLHEPHDLVPIAMVNRAPHGSTYLSFLYTNYNY